jgi:hypothetical protein
VPAAGIFAIASDMEEPLNEALAFTRGLALMGYGLESIASDHGGAVLASAESIARELGRAKKIWRQIMAVSGRAKSHKKPRK